MQTVTLNQRSVVVLSIKENGSLEIASKLIDVAKDLSQHLNHLHVKVIVLPPEVQITVLNPEH